MLKFSQSQPISGTAASGGTGVGADVFGDTVMGPDVNGKGEPSLAISAGQGRRRRRPRPDGDVASVGEMGPKASRKQRLNSKSQKNGETSSTHKSAVATDPR